MRVFPVPALAVFVLAAFFVSAPCALAATPDPATPEPLLQHAAPSGAPGIAQAGALSAAPAAGEQKSGVQAEPGETPPPFILRPKRPPQPARPDLTYATRPAPKSFRELPWGVSLEQAKASLGLVAVTSPKPLPGTFQRPGELLKLGQADVRTVAYYFPRGQFAGAGIMFEGEANFFLIKDHLIELYGPGRQVGDRYGWTWESVNIDLRMKSGAGELRYTYEPPAKK